MAELKTDEETVEDIKKWWKENGTAVIAGVVIGLGAIFGWRAWIDYRDSVGQRASLAFEQVLVATSGGETESAVRQAEQLVDELGGSAYAMLAELAVAKAQLDAGDPDAAISALSTAVDKAPEPGLARLAALRLVRLQIDQGDLEAASQTIDAHDDGGPFHGDFAALRGDIAAAQGEREAAAVLYREAMEAGTGNAGIIELLLDELAPAPIPAPDKAAQADDDSAPAASGDETDASAAPGDDAPSAAQLTEAPADQPTEPAADAGPADTGEATAPTD
jgi:predicted negative regulator of RcsB-dependent stress response